MMVGLVYCGVGVGIGWLRWTMVMLGEGGVHCLWRLGGEVVMEVCLGDE